MIRSALRTGLRRVRQRPGLVVLVAVVHLGAALALSVVVAGVAEAALAGTGFGAVLAREFDLVLWHDVIERYGSLLGTLAQKALWLLPLAWAAKVLLRVGLVYALGRGGDRPWTEGMRRYGVRALLLALLYGAVLALWFVGTLLVGLLANLLAGGIVSVVWINVVAVPALLVVGVVLVDLMHDYGRTALVLDRQHVLPAWRTGAAWPWRHRPAVGVYAAWFVVGAALWGVPLLLDATLPAATTGGVWALVILQQIVFAARAAVTVGWLGSEVAVYEDVREAAWPLIAGEPATPEAA